MVNNFVISLMFVGVPCQNKLSNYVFYQRTASKIDHELTADKWSTTLYDVNRNNDVHLQGDLEK